MSPGASGRQRNGWAAAHEAGGRAAEEPRPRPRPARRQPTVARRRSPRQRRHRAVLGTEPRSSPQRRPRRPGRSRPPRRSRPVGANDDVASPPLVAGSRRIRRATGERRCPRTSTNAGTAVRGSRSDAPSRTSLRPSPALSVRAGRPASVCPAAAPFLGGGAARERVETEAAAAGAAGGVALAVAATEGVTPARSTGAHARSGRSRRSRPRCSRTMPRAMPAFGRRTPSVSCSSGICSTA